MYVHCTHMYMYIVRVQYKLQTPLSLQVNQYIFAQIDTRTHVHTSLKHAHSE